MPEPEEEEESLKPVVDEDEVLTGLKPPVTVVPPTPVVQEPAIEEPEPVITDVVPELEPEPEPIAEEPEPVPEPVVEEPEPVVEEPEPEPITEQQAPTPEPELEPVAVEQVAVPDEEHARQVEAEVSEGSYLYLKGLDLNKATANDLVKNIDGLGLKLAQRIVAYREKNGPYFFLIDLARVPGLGEKTFEQITGMPLRTGVFRQLPIVASVCWGWRWGSRMCGRSQSASRRSAGFEGCMLAHTDGYVMAESWVSDKSEAFGAFAPQMYKKIATYVQELDLGGLGSITFFLEEQPFTLVRSGEIFLIAVHTPNRYSRKHVLIAQAVGSELGRRLTNPRSAR